MYVIRHRVESPDGKVLVTVSLSIVAKTAAEADEFTRHLSQRLPVNEFDANHDRWWGQTHSGMTR
jgi:hypothetical protein